MPPRPSRKPAPEPPQNLQSLKGTFVLVLMAPVLIALVAGAWWTWQGAEQGLPLLAGGVVMAAFNVFILKYLFARLQAEADKEAQGTRDQEPRP